MALGTRNREGLGRAGVVSNLQNLSKSEAPCTTRWRWWRHISRLLGDGHRWLISLFSVCVSSNGKNCTLKQKSMVPGLSLALKQP